MTNEQQLAIRDEFDLPDTTVVTRKLQQIKAFQALVNTQLVRDLDYGTIPGTAKPTLLKPGAEKISKLLGLADHYEVTQRVEDWDRPLFSYEVRCSLVSIQTGTTISTGLGQCNSMEGKYRWRQAKPKCPKCHQETIGNSKEEYGGGYYCDKRKGGCGVSFKANNPATKTDREAIERQQVGRVPNEDIYTQVNTILKMAKKRALVDAALSAGRLSEIFTQDMEDISDAVAVVINADPFQDAPAEAPSAPAGSKPPVQAQSGKDGAKTVAGGDAAEIGGQLLAVQKELGWTNQQVTAYVKQEYQKDRVSALSIDQMRGLLSKLRAIVNPMEDPQEETSAP